MIDDIGDKTRKGLYWNFLLKIPYEIFRFGVSIIVARILAPTDFGIVSIASMLIYYSNTLTNFGFHQALVQRNEITSRHLNSVFTLDLSISVSMAVIFFVFSPFMAAFFNSPESSNVIRVMSPIFILTTFYELPHALLRREMNFKTASILETVKELSMSLITLCLAVIGFRYWAVVWGQMIPLALCSVYLWIKIGWYPKLLYHHPSVKDLMNFSLWSFIRAQIYFLQSRADRLIIGRFYGPTMLGLYDKAKSLSQMPNESIAGHLSTVLFSSFSRMQDNIQEANNIHKKSVLLLSVLVFPIYFGLFAIAPQFVIVFLGENWSPAIVPLQILCISGLFYTLNEPIGTFLMGAGDYIGYTIRQIIGTCFLVCTSLVVVRWGIEAVAAGILLHSTLLFCMNVGLLKKTVDFRWKTLAPTIFPAFFCSVAMFVCVKTISVLFLEKVNLINLCLLTAIGVVTYFFSLLLFPGSRLDELRVSFRRDVVRFFYTFKKIGLKK